MSKINYSQCWEDGALLKTALAVTSDDVVLSITSGGDNAIALLLEGPKKIFSIDINPAQNYLAELKLLSTRVLNHSQYLEFLGVTSSTKRWDYYLDMSGILSKDAYDWFFDNKHTIIQGVIHSGKFEKYLNRFRKYVLPLVHSTKTIRMFTTQVSLSEQVVFYKDVWDSWRWRFFFTIASNPFLLQKQARQHGAKEGRIGANDNYFTRLEKLICRSLIRTNFYLHYALTGDYGDYLPEYLLQSNYSILQECDLDVCEFIYQDLISFLSKTPNSSLTKYNLSDTFDFLMNEDAETVWKEIIRTATDGAKVVYWCNQVEHVPPKEVMQNLVPETSLARELYERDRLYFYRSFNIYRITK